MTKFSSLTVATLLMGSLALPAFAQGSSTPVAPQKDASAITTPPAKPKHHSVKVTSTAKPGIHKAAATAEVPATVAKPTHGATATTTTTTTAAPATDMKAGTPVVPGAVVPAKEAAKDGSMKTTAPVTKTN